MFTARQNRNWLEAAGTTLVLIYHVTVYNLRKEHGNAIIGLLMTILQSCLFILGFFGFYLILGVRHSPIRGDFTLYIMSGIFLFMAYTQCMAQVSGISAGAGQLTKHGPLNTAVLITAAALAVLYRMTLSILVLCWAFAMFMLAWFAGACVGLIFLALRPWWPAGIKILMMAFQRLNMIASGKMFVANNLPTPLLRMFAWNPLFHIIDQTRGFIFINYSPRNSSVEYAVYVTLAILMVGLMGEFVTRNAQSLSWSAGK